MKRAARPVSEKPTNTTQKRKLEESSEKPPAKKVQQDDEEDQIVLHPAVEFLRTWKTDRQRWTFDGTKQRALINQCLNAQIVDGKHFKYFLEYIAPMVGIDRVKLYEMCRDYVKTQRANAQKNALHELPSSERKSITTDKKIRQKCVKEMRDILQDNKRYKRAKTVMLVLKATDKDSGSRYNLDALEQLAETDFEEESEKTIVQESAPKKTKKDVSSDSSSSDSDSSDSDSSSSDSE